MAASVVIEDTNGNEIPLDDTTPVDFGTVGSGSTSDEVELQVTNDGDADVFFVTVQGKLHPDAQVGEREDTVDAVSFSKQAGGNFSDQVSWNEIPQGESRSFFARWTVPSKASGGDRVWAIEAAASTS